jgi:hypothetical protein
MQPPSSTNIILLKVPTNKPNTRVTWNFRKANWIKFQDQVEIKRKCTQNAQNILQNYTTQCRRKHTERQTTQV